MPWIALVCACLVGGCYFDADYRSGTVRCRDGKCPSGLACDPDKVCRAPREDAGVDTTGDAPDARQPMLICGDPGRIAVTGGQVSGTTAARSNLVAAQCSAGVMNGNDAVYEIELPPGKQVSLAVSTTTSGYQVAAYMMAPCPAATCLSSMYATLGNPATITTTTATPQFIVIDSIIAGSGGDYTLIVTVN